MFIEKDNYYYIEEFEKVGIKAVYTKRSMGNMSDFSKVEGAEEKIQKINREKLLNELGLNGKKQVFAHQTHSNNVQNIDENSEKYIYEKEYNIDGFITKRKDVAIFTFYADCLPIFVYDKRNEVIGVWHSGWTGTYKEMLKSGLEKMKSIYNTSYDDVIVAFGIGMQSKYYEVGDEFYSNFCQKFGKDSELVKNSFWFNESTNKYHFDNMKFNVTMAIKLGINEKNIIISNEDTYSDKEENGEYKFHSYRRDKMKLGSATAMISFI